LSELRDRILMLSSLENRLSFLQEEIQKAEINVSTLLQKYTQEKRDVEHIQKNSLSSFILKIIQKYENKLEKEQKEEINAKLAYDYATTHLSALISERDELTSRINSLRVEEQTYHTELTHRRNELADKLTEPDGICYAKLENERNVIISQLTDINEALTAAASVKLTAQKILDSLRSAENWATYDVFAGGGIIIHAAKYSHIDNAEKNFHLLSSQLRNLKSELNDVHDLTVPELNEISSNQRIIDFWFDNIFTDLSVRGKIRDNTEQIRYLLHNINSIMSTLKSKLTDEEAKLVENKRCEEELLLSIR